MSSTGHSSIGFIPKHHTLFPTPQPAIGTRKGTIRRMIFARANYVYQKTQYPIITKTGVARASISQNTEPASQNDHLFRKASKQKQIKLQGGVVAEWSNAQDSKSCSFGSVCSNQAHVEKVQKKRGGKTFIFAISHSPHNLIPQDETRGRLLFPFFFFA